MKLSRIFFCLFLILTATAARFAFATPPDSLTGFVRDGEGKPLAGATVKLTWNRGAPFNLQTVSSPSGEYRFAGLAYGDYTLATELSGYTSSAPVSLHILPSSTPVKVDLILMQSLPTPELSGFGSASSSASQSASSHPALEFQSTGIRGLIDPGGYSASTGSASTGLLRGIADVKRTSKSFGASTAKDWPCALELQLRKTVDEHPDQAEANRRLGQFYVSHEQPSKAIPLLKRALQIDSFDIVASRSLAIAFLQSGDFDAARTLLTPLANSSANAEINQLLARADEGLGQFQQAVQQYRIAEGKEPSEESLFGIGYELLLAGSVADSVLAFHDGIQRFSQSIPLRIGLGTALFYQGKTADALRSILDATDTDPSDSRPYTFLASLSAITSEESERVRFSFKRYLERAPNSAAANYDYALALSRRNDSTDAAQLERLLKRAIQLDPNLAKAHLQLADIYAQRNDDADALPEYEAAVRLAQDLGEAHYRLAMAYKRVGKTDQSAREMQIFRLSKQKQSADSEGIDLTQFISVMDTSDKQQGQETQCPAISR
jgi:tetratricopeptide (TPR) repeat protein